MTLSKLDVRDHGRLYHFFRDRRYTRRPIDRLLTTSTRPISTTAVPYWISSETPRTCVPSVNRCIDRAMQRSPSP